MSSQIIDCDASAPFWTQTTTLDGVPYLLTFRFNSREKRYYLCIDSSDGTINYVQGLALVCGIFLLSTYPTPPGELVILNQSVSDEPPALGELADGARCTLLYIPQADLFAPGNTVDPQRFRGFIV